MAWSAREGSLPSSSLSSSLSSSSLNIINTAGWLRQEALLAETEKKTLDALKMENGGPNANDPLTAAMLPGMDPSTMMVSDPRNDSLLSCCNMYILG